MFGLIAKLTAVPGERDRLIEAIAESIGAMPGCISYVMAKDATDESVVWVTEIWVDQASHDASLQLPAVLASIAAARPLVAHFEKVAATTPVRGVPGPYPAR